MPRRWILRGIAGILLLAGGGLAMRILREGNSTAAMTTSAVTRAFAARGIALEVEPKFGLPIGSTEHALGIFSNRPASSRQGVVVVIVVRSSAQAKALGSRRIDPHSRNVCGGKTASDYRVWQSRNVVATLSKCDYLHGQHEATAPAFAEVASVMSYAS